MFKAFLVFWCVQGTVFASDLGVRLSKVKVFQQAFPVEHIIKVQETDDLLLSRITQAVFFDDAIFVLDRSQQVIYQLDRTG